MPPEQPALVQTSLIQSARAVNSYGSEGDSNGVTVTFGTTANGSAADKGPSPNGGLSFDANGRATAQVLVTISDSASTDTNSLSQAIGHEGWHVADRQSFANYLTGQIQGAGGLANFIGTPLETAAFNSSYNSNSSNHRVQCVYCLWTNRTRTGCFGQ